MLILLTSELIPMKSKNENRVVKNHERKNRLSDISKTGESGRTMNQLIIKDTKGEGWTGIP